MADWDDDIRFQIETDARYAGYLDRQRADIEAFRRDEALALPADMDYLALEGMATEVRQKLAAARPVTLGQAARLDGMTPAALTLFAASRPQSPCRGGRIGLWTPKHLPKPTMFHVKH